MLKVEVKEVRTSLYIFRIIGSGQWSKFKWINFTFQEPISQIEPEYDDDSGGEQPLYIKEDEDEDEPVNEDGASMDSTDGNDTRLSDLHNTTIKTEEDSDEDVPLVSETYIRADFYLLSDVYVMHNKNYVEFKIHAILEL